MIKLTNVSKKIKGTKIIKDINLSFEPGEMTFIVGSSGAGKTTLLNIIGGLIEKYDGKVEYDGVDIKENIYDYRAGSVGYIFQDYNLIEGMSVKDNISLAVDLSKSEFDEEKYDELMQELKIKSEIQTVETLSGGEKQRIAIIRSIMKKSRIVIADEPTGNLDSVNSDEVFTLLKELSHNRYMIIVTHDTDKARKYADRIITLDDGNVVSDERYNKAIESTDCPQPNIKVSLKKKLGAIWKIGINSIKKRKRKLFSVTAALIMAVCCISMFVTIFSIGRKTVKGTNINFLESDLLHISYAYDSEGNYQLKSANHIMSSEQTKQLMSKYDIKEIVPVYEMTTEGMSFVVDDKKENVEYKPINVDKFFEDRIMDKDIQGNFPQNDYEIIIASDLASKFFSGDCIGQKITLYGEDPKNGIELTIVGVNKKLSTDDTIRNYISSNVFKELKEIGIAYHMSQGYFNTWCCQEYQGGMHGYSSGPIGYADVSDNNEKLIRGRYIENPNEILISSDNYDNCKDFIDNEIQGYNDSEHYILSEYNGHDMLYVAGVYESEESGIRISTELAKSFKDVSPIEIQAYVKNVDNVESIAKKICENEEYGAAVYDLKMKQEVGNTLNMLFFFLRLIAFVVVILTFVMVGSYATICIHERSKEIGIVKSLGANRNTIVCVTMFDILFMFVATVIGSYIVTNLIYLILSNTLLKVRGTYYYCPFYVTFLTSLILSLVYGVQLRIKMRKFIKKAPADLLRE